MLFDWQPITTGNIITGVVGLVALFSLWYLIRGFGQSRRSVDLAISESKFRNRPWLGVTGCEYLSASKELEVRYQNIGTLPAYNLVLTLTTDEDTPRVSIVSFSARPPPRSRRP